MRQGQIEFRRHFTGRKVNILAGVEAWAVGVDEPTYLQFRQFLDGDWTEWANVPEPRRVQRPESF